MNRTITFLSIIVFAIGCKSKPEPFEYTIRGTVIGQDSGQFYLSESPRAGDEIAIPFKDHKFEYIGTTPNMFKSWINFKNDDPGGLYPIVIEPGEIILELYSDSVALKSKVIAGYYNLSFKKDQKELNYGEIIEIYRIENWEDFLPVDKIGEVLNGIEDKEVKKSREYIKLYSIWLSKKDSINRVGKKAMDLKLLNAKKETISFQSVAKNKIAYVEKSGSWCGNSTRLTNELKPVYEKYKDKGFEIITADPESRLDRWENWLEKHEFPWTNLVELEVDVANTGISYTDILFRGYGIANYLVDANGEVVATNISTEELNEFLMETFEPEVYMDYVKKKWTVPEGINILDRGGSINSFDELVQHMSGKSFFIDCWATWCSPCIEEFSRSEQLDAFLKSKGIELVYINFDRSIYEMTWLNTIRKYKLIGNHLRANEAFQNDLYNSGIITGALPQYMIVDSGGEVVVKDAFRPSDKETLYKQIENTIVKNVP